MDSSSPLLSPSSEKISPSSSYVSEQGKDISFPPSMISRSSQLADVVYATDGRAPQSALHSGPLVVEAVVKQPRKHPFSKRFEAPDWKELAKHFVLCGLTYPFLLLFVILSRNRTLFIARLLVGLGCGAGGLLLGLSLLNLARGIIEAATWATLIHQSRVANNGGVALKDLADQTDDHRSAISAVMLMWNRRSYVGTKMENRKDYDQRRWTPYIIYFLLNVLMAGAVSFLLGRVVDINVRLSHQEDRYKEIAVMGTLSSADLETAKQIQTKSFDDYRLSWTLASMSEPGNLPEVLEFQHINTTVYLSEVAMSQFLPNGTGFGTFKPVAQHKINLYNDPSSSEATADGLNKVEAGAVVMFPRWGLEVKCQKIANPQMNILNELAASLQYKHPPKSEGSYNYTQQLAPGDTFGSTDFSAISLASAFADTGVAQVMHSYPLSMGENGDGFSTIEVVLIRINSTYAPQAAFATRGPTQPDGSFLGFDAAVCLEVFRPYVMAVYNTTVGLPTTLRIASQNDVVTDLGKHSKLVGRPIDPDNVARKLDSTGFAPAYIAAHQNGINHMLKDNGREDRYVPSPALISYTNGTGSDGYTEFDISNYERSRGRTDANTMLPYFAGSGPILARVFHDQISTTVTIYSGYMAALLGLVFVMGLISALFTPTLPLNTPRRGFDLYSWLSAFQAQELVAERPNTITKGMPVKTIEETHGDVKFRYVG